LSDLALAEIFCLSIRQGHVSRWWQWWSYRWWWRWSWPCRIASHKSL